jgi:hypothetical protein
MTGGYLLAGLSMLLLLVLEADSPFSPVLLIAQIGLGLGLGTALEPATSLSDHGVGEEESAMASEMINIAQQVGGCAPRYVSACAPVPGAHPIQVCARQTLPAHSPPRPGRRVSPFTSTAHSTSSHGLLSPKCAMIEG